MTLTRWFRSAAFIVLAAFSLNPASRAQYSKFQQMSNELAKQLTLAKISCIAVAPFSHPQGKESALDEYFAAALSSALRETAKEVNFSDASSPIDTRAAEKPTPKDLSPCRTTRPASSVLQVDAILLAIVETKPDGYVITASVRRVPDGSIVGTASDSINRSEFPNGFDVAVENEHIFSIEQDGVSHPTCVHCPDARYTKEARKKKFQGNILMYVIITAEGRVEHIQPVKTAGYGLDEETYKTVKEWRLTPAKKADGTPVPVAVPIEVVFRLM